MNGVTEESYRLAEENERLRRRVAELEGVAARLGTTLQSIGDAVISVDTGGNIVSMNPKPVDFDAFLQAVGSLGLYWLLVNQPAK